jgi:hypothetical protein
MEVVQTAKGIFVAPMEHEGDGYGYVKVKLGSDTKRLFGYELKPDGRGSIELNGQRYIHKKCHPCKYQFDVPCSAKRTEPCDKCSMSDDNLPF